MGIGDKMGGQHAFNSLTPYTTVDPATLSQICLYCSRSHNSRDQLMNHLRFHYQMALICPICAGCGPNSWRAVEAHIKACAKSRSTNAPDDVNQEDRGHLINKTLSEMQEHLKALKEEADRAAKAKMSTHCKKAKETD